MVRHTVQFNFLTLQSITLYRILVGKTLSTSQLILTVVWLRSHYVVLDFNNLTLLCTQQSSSVVTVLEVVALLTGSFLYQSLTDNRLGIHSNQSSQTVTTVNIHSLCYRAKAVSSVYVTFVQFVVFQTPSQLVVCILLPVVSPEVAQIVNVSTFTADYLTEQAFLSHVQSVQFEEVIAAVLQLDTVLASLL